MTETNERIAALETKMEYALGVLSKREDYQNSVLKSLTIIEMKQDQALGYQKTCDAERAAHGSRIGQLENGFSVLKGKAAGIGAVVSLVISLATVWASGKHP